MTTPPAPPEPPPGRPILSSSGLFILMAGLCAIIGVTAVFGVPWFLALSGSSLAQKAAGVFGRVFQSAPVVTIKGDSVVLEKSAVAELAVCQRKTQVVMKYESQWLNSSKVLVVRGDFIIKAGFDLKQEFRFTVSQPEREVVVELPRPKILSVEFQSYEVLYSSDGVINKIQPQDQERVVNEMLAKARADAEKSDITAEATEQVERRVRDLLQGTLEKVSVRFRAPEPAQKTARHARA
jgi:hypothetical protein